MDHTFWWKNNMKNNENNSVIVKYFKCPRGNNDFLQQYFMCSAVYMNLNIRNNIFILHVVLWTLVKYDTLYLTRFHKIRVEILI